VGKHQRKRDRRAFPSADALREKVFQPVGAHLFWRGEGGYKEVISAWGFVLGKMKNRGRRWGILKFLRENEGEKQSGLELRFWREIDP